MQNTPVLVTTTTKRPLTKVILAYYFHNMFVENAGLRLGKRHAVVAHLYRRRLHTGPEGPELEG